MHTKQSNAYEMYTNRMERLGDFTWRVSDCEELVGSITGEDGVGFKKFTQLILKDYERLVGNCFFSQNHQRLFHNLK